MKRIIVGTSGHIDHGKTTLVKALTGIDADRLKEEKERGITIDIGFADLTIGDVHFGFVDVPGHERFVKNMLAGAHGLDLVMLVIAADEGLMPQTREHFDICRLLEVQSGLIVITKADLADEELLQLVELETEEYVNGSFLAGAPILRVSSTSGQGIEELKKTLVQLARQVAERDADAVARLPIDRVFTIRGFGTVVTGTLIAGRIRTGDELDLIPANDLRTKARSLQVHGHTTQEAFAGERTAINLQGVEIADVSRGQSLAPVGRLRATQMLDVKLQLLASSPRALRTRSRVRLHCGTAEILARVVVLGKSEIAPGESAFAQLRLESPVLILPGDRFILRSYSPSITIGGGRVVDALPPKHRLREAANVIAQLEKLSAAQPQKDQTEFIALLVEMADVRGMSQAALAARCGATDAVIQRAAETLVKNRRLVAASPNPWLLLARPAFDSLASRVRETLKAHHKKAPLEAGLGREEIRERIFSRLPVEIFKAVIVSLVERGEVIADKDLLRLAAHRVELSPEDKAARDHLSAVFSEAALQPISLEEAVAQTGRKFAIDLQRTQRFAQMLINSGELVRVSDLIFHRATLENLRQTLQQYKASGNVQLDVAGFKDLTGVSRKYAIPLLEYLDRQRVTRRVGDLREIL
jgi:selenocysteine-specific elongation factor